MRFSILICSITGRESLLGRILSLLESQKNKKVEILVETDDRKMTIGEKRNILLQRARGDYIAFVDDDDLVVNDYISKVLQAVETNPDCCGMEGLLISLSKKTKTKFIHSIRYDHWFVKEGIYYRTPNHISPVKRELALQAVFPESNHGEDHTYSRQLFPLLKTEEYIEGPIYFYYTG